MEVFFLICVVVICICLPMAIRSTAKDRKQAESSSNFLSAKINNIHMQVFGTGEGTPAQQLDALWHFAEKNIGDILNGYVENHRITKIADTYSDLGLCGISNTHFFALLDQTDSSEYDALVNAGNLKSKYNEFQL